MRGCRGRRITELRLRRERCRRCTLPLPGCQGLQIGPSLVGYGQQNTAAVFWIGRLFDQAHVLQLVGGVGDEAGRDVQVIGEGFDIHRAAPAEPRDRNQDRVFDPGKAYLPRVSCPHRFMSGVESEEIVHQLAKHRIVTVNQKFLARNRQRRLRNVLAAMGRLVLPWCLSLSIDLFSHVSPIFGLPKPVDS